MSYWVAGSVVVSAVAGAASSKNASDKAAEGQEKGMNQSLDITSKARNDVMKLFQQSAQQSALAKTEALKFYQQNAPKRIAPYQAGNMAAQQVIGQGATQANNAILGLPVDMSFANQPQQIQADYGGVASAQLPKSAGLDVSQLQQSQQQEAQPAQEQEKNIAGFGGSGPFLGLTDKKRFDLVQLGKNPLGLNDKNLDKIQPKNVTKKVKNLLGL